MAARKNAKKSSARKTSNTGGRGDAVVDTVPLGDTARIDRLERVVRELRPSAFPEPEPPRGDDE